MTTLPIKLRDLLRKAWGGGARQNRERLALLAASPLFDRAWYLARYPDVAASKADPTVHYLEHGWREGRDPGPAFSTTAYLQAHPDVVRAKVNPLVHYIEHGYSEGRGSSRHGPSVPRIRYVDESFGPAAPCATFPLIHEPPVRWIRQAKLQSESGDVFAIGELVIGRVDKPVVRDTLSRQFYRLALFSGVADPSFEAEDSAAQDPAASLIDAWYVNYDQVRSRWESRAGPIVLRAYQHDPRRGNALTLVGEGLVVSNVDFVDARLRNPYFPVLFVVSEPNGKICSTQMVAFPSLCRGGLHYSELLTLAEPVPGTRANCFHFTASSEALARQLLAIRTGKAKPVYEILLLDLAGADGSQPMFQPDFRTWLDQVHRIGIRSTRAGDDEPRMILLARTAELHAAKPRDGGDRELVLPADMIPTLGSLVMTETEDSSATGERLLPFLIGAWDPAQPATLIRPPPKPRDSSRVRASDYPAIWPKIRNGEIAAGVSALGAAAIRMPDPQPPDNAELLVPISGQGLPRPERARPITWLILAAEWKDKHLTAALHSLSLQNGADGDGVTVVGMDAQSVAESAERFFPRRVKAANHLKDAVAGLSTPLAGYVGSGIVLHDRRCADVLRWLHEDQAVMTASCVILVAEKRGKAWKVAVTDAGTVVAGDGARAAAVDQSDVACRLWRSTYPVILPPRDLWVARTSFLRELHEQPISVSDQGVHVCTSIVTASYADAGSALVASLRVPETDASRALQVELLFG